MHGPAIAFRNVGIRFGGQDILKDISFAVKAGEIHAIVGPNGGGKTTLIRALLGQTPHEGQIDVGGGKEFIIGYAPQFLELDRNMPITVRDVLTIMNQRRPVFLGRSGANRPEQDAALERLGLKDKAKQLYGSLSGGERQRVLFAQALVPNPDLLIMDEPTSNMDEAGALLVESIVRELAKNGTTVMWVNHDWAQVRRVADTVTMISRVVTAHGTPETTIPALPGGQRIYA